MAAVSADETPSWALTLTPMAPKWPVTRQAPFLNGRHWRRMQAPSTPWFPRGPFASEQPQFTITAQNVDHTKTQAGAGAVRDVQALSRATKCRSSRPIAAPPAPAKLFASIENATPPRWCPAATVWKTSKPGNRSRFPRALETIWNHITRYRGGSVKRLVTQTTPQTNGSFSLVYFKDQFVFSRQDEGLRRKSPGNVLFCFKQQVTAPSRLAGGAAGPRKPSTR